MTKVKQAVKKLLEKVRAEKYWLFPSQIKLMKVEAKKNWDGNKSALMRHIINTWFNK